MILLYTIDWRKIDPQSNIIQITCIDERGRIQKLNKIYKDWIGICTSDIKSIVSKIKHFFPGIKIKYDKIHQPDMFIKVLPYFKKRLQTENFDYEKHPFYKVYELDCCCSIEDIGTFFNQYDIAYFHKTDWLTRVYIDFSTRYQTQNGFFYKWYEVDEEKPDLMDAFQMKTNMNFSPRWKIAAFDIETVSLENTNRIPNGMDPSDRIVMISIIKWQQDYQQNILSKKDYILYLNPTTEEIKTHLNNNKDKKYAEYQSEIQLLNDFHYLVGDCHVLTGYNINKFDIPCIFARLLWLGQYRILKDYSSYKIGNNLVTTFQEKIVIDEYDYFNNFSNYDLTSHKLDIVAKIKLGDSRKLAIDSVGIHYWYHQKEYVTKDLCLSNDPQYCFEILKPTRVSSPDRFGTFSQYLEYCIRDSELVFKLFRKEMILGFLTARANFGPLNVMQALHLGNSRILLEIFKSYGMVIGFFLNTDFLENQSDVSKYSSMFGGKTFQGALNYCLKREYFNDVTIFDFNSMYPSTILDMNLCYGTCDILSTEEYTQSLSENVKKYLTVIPYRTHEEKDFQDETVFDALSTDNCFFRYPLFDPEKDSFVIVSNQHSKAFLPTLVENLIRTRKCHQQQWKATQNVYFYNSQLCIKILLNSIYGTMAADNSPLAYSPIAIAITALARYQLLGSYHYVQYKLGYKICYADTDSLMIHRWPFDNCDVVNRFLSSLTHSELKFENRMKRFLIYSKKKYIYELDDGIIHVKGFGIKINDLIKYMMTKITNAVMKTLKLKKEEETLIDPSDGWILWVETLREAFFMCRDPKKYSISRKIKKLDEYVSTSCASVKMLKKYPEIEKGGYIEYTYSRADVSKKESLSWIMIAKDCRYVNFEQLFMSQKKILITLLDMVYWNSPKAEYNCDMVLNTMRWKSFLNAELKLYFKTGGKKVILMMEKRTRYTFQINDCFSNNGRKSVVLKKRSIEMAEEETKTNIKKKN